MAMDLVKVTIFVVDSELGNEGGEMQSDVEVTGTRATGDVSTAGICL